MAMGQSMAKTFEIEKNERHVGICSHVWDGSLNMTRVLQAECFFPGMLTFQHNEKTWLPGGISRVVVGVFYNGIFVKQPTKYGSKKTK